MNNELKVELISAVNAMVDQTIHTLLLSEGMRTTKERIFATNLITEQDILFFLSGYLYAIDLSMTTDVSEVLEHFYN